MVVNPDRVAGACRRIESVSVEIRPVNPSSPCCRSRISAQSGTTTILSRVWRMKSSAASPAFRACRCARECRRLHSRINRATCARWASSSERIWSWRGATSGPAPGYASTPDWFRSRGMFLYGPSSTIASSMTCSLFRMKSRGRSSTSFDWLWVRANGGTTSISTPTFSI